MLMLIILNPLDVIFLLIFKVFIEWLQAYFTIIKKKIKFKQFIKLYLSTSIFCLRFCKFCSFKKSRASSR